MIYWYEIIDENSPYEGKIFIIDNTHGEKIADSIAEELCPNIEFIAHGTITEEQLECFDYLFYFDTDLSAISYKNAKIFSYFIDKVDFKWYNNSVRKE